MASRSRSRDPRTRQTSGIATVYQDLALCDNLDVVANLFLGQEVVGNGRGRAATCIDEIEMEQRANQLLDQLAVPPSAAFATEVGSFREASAKRWRSRGPCSASRR